MAKRQRRDFNSAAVAFAKAKFREERKQWHELIHAPYEVPQWILDLQRNTVLVAFEAYRTLLFCYRNSL